MVLSQLPAVDALADDLAGTGLPRAVCIEIARSSIDLARANLQSGVPADAAAMAHTEAAAVVRLRPTAVINTTGVLLHTNLGRAPLALPAAGAAGDAATGYGNLEFDLGTGARGSRGAYVRRLLTSLTGAEDALVVNNNAAALLLALAALAAGRHVIVSRGELIEIGGSFRLPTLMAASGAWLVEVGTTNRTRRTDYEEAFTIATAAVLKVHPSNYRVEGFTEAVEYAELADVARTGDVPLIADIGGGLLDAGVPWVRGGRPGWLGDEPGARQVVEAGASLVLFSGDKLLGGPQAGIVVGRAELISRLARHPINRALRCGGSALAALATTLELYAAGRGGEIPFWAMAALPYEQLAARADWVLATAAVDGVVAEGESLPGAGTVPGRSIPSPVIRIPGGHRAWTRLLAGDPPVVARRDEGDLIIDLRAVDAGTDAALAKALQQACRS